MKKSVDSKANIVVQKANKKDVMVNTYPANEDMYNNAIEEQNIDPEDVSKLKDPNTIEKNKKANEKDFEEDKSGDDLDVPGAELDDEEEEIGSEDEENNYYSIGGNNHNDLEENRE